MPAGLVHRHVELHVRGAVGPRTQRVVEFVRAGIGVRRPGFWPAAAVHVEELALVGSVARAVWQAGGIALCLPAEASVLRDRGLAINSRLAGMERHRPLLLRRPVVAIGVPREQPELRRRKLLGQGHQLWVGVERADPAGDARRVRAPLVVEVPGRGRVQAQRVRRILGRDLGAGVLPGRILEPMPRQAAVADFIGGRVTVEVQRRLRRPMAGGARDEERKSLHRRGRHARHRGARQRHDGRVGRAADELAVRQVAVRRARLEHVMTSP